MYSFLPLAPVNEGIKLLWTQYEVAVYVRILFQEPPEALYPVYHIQHTSGVSVKFTGKIKVLHWTRELGDVALPVSRMSGRMETRQMLFSLHSSLKMSSFNNCTGVED